MPLIYDIPNESPVNRVARLNAFEQTLKELEAKVKVDAATIYQQAQQKLAVREQACAQAEVTYRQRLTAVDQRESAVAAQAQAIQAREASVQQLLSETQAQQARLLEAEREAIIARQTLRDQQSSLTISLKAHQEEMARWQQTHHAKQEALEQQQVKAVTDQQAQATALKAHSQAIAVAQAEHAYRIENFALVKSQHQALHERLTEDHRVHALRLDARQQQVEAQAKEVTQREHAVSSQLADIARREQAAALEQQTLHQFRADLDLRELRLKKVQKDVDTTIEAHALRAEFPA